MNKQELLTSVNLSENNLKVLEILESKFKIQIDESYYINLNYVTENNCDFWISVFCDEEEVNVLSQLEDYLFNFIDIEALQAQIDIANHYGRNYDIAVIEQDIKDYLLFVENTIVDIKNKLSIA